MRYIDADELERIKFYPLPYPHITPTDCDAESYKRGWNDVIDAIVDCQPTADVRENIQLDVCPLYGGACGYPSSECYDCPRHGNFRENVRGEWLDSRANLYDKKHVYKQCSNCGTGFIYGVVMPKRPDGKIPIHTQFHNYCPNCGARMIRGES